MSSVISLPLQSLGDEALLHRLYELAIKGDDRSDEFHRLDTEMKHRFHVAPNGPTQAPPASVPSSMRGFSA